MCFERTKTLVIYQIFQLYSLNLPWLTVGQIGVPSLPLDTRQVPSKHFTLIFNVLIYFI